MKALLTLTLIISCIYVKAQDKTTLQLIDGKIIYERVGIVDSVSSEQIHERVLNWIGSTFKSAEAVISSETASRIVGDFTIMHDNGIAGTDFTHRVTIDIKEGRFKFTINAHELSGWVAKNKNTEWRTHYAAMKTRVENDLNLIFKDLLAEVSTNSKDW